MPILSVQFSSVQLLSHVRLFATPWIAARQASLSITNFQSSPRLSSIKPVMPSSRLIFFRPLLLLPPTPPSIRVFSNESTLLMRWPKTVQIPLWCSLTGSGEVIPCLSGPVPSTSLFLCRPSESLRSLSLFQQQNYISLIQPSTVPWRHSSLNIQWTIPRVDENGLITSTRLPRSWAVGHWYLRGMNSILAPNLLAVVWELLPMATLEQSCFYKNLSTVIFILNFWYPSPVSQRIFFSFSEWWEKRFWWENSAFMTHFQKSTHSVL